MPLNRNSQKFSCIDVKQCSSYDSQLATRNRTMKNLAENNLVRFISVTKKKDGLFANFRVKGVRNGATYSASIAVDLSAADVDLADPLERIIEMSAPIAVKQLQSDVQFEGLIAV